MSKNLIIYYSCTGENYWNGSIKNISKGNTEIVAEFIQKAVGGDLFQVEAQASVIFQVSCARVSLHRSCRCQVCSPPPNTAARTRLWPVSSAVAP